MTVSFISTMRRALIAGATATLLFAGAGGAAAAPLSAAPDRKSVV